MSINSLPYSFVDNLGTSLPPSALPPNPYFAARQYAQMDPMTALSSQAPVMDLCTTM
jgi:hypothetical protein